MSLRVRRSIMNRKNRIASGKPIITLHDEELDHALKEVDAAARATARTPEQVVEILTYVLS